jgi:N-acyl-phosphatidylethanolamine-hydrolysing phospholipase D
MPKNAYSPIKTGVNSYYLYSRLKACLSLSGAVMFLLAGCAASNPYYDASKPHHTPEGFKNNYIDTVSKPLSSLLRWQLERRRDGLPPPPATATPTVAADVALITANARDRAAMQPMITWIGHATMLVQAGGLNVLTDPMFSQRAAPTQWFGPRRAQPPGLSIDQLPPIDVVVISHNHYDHLDENSVVALDKKAGGATLFIVPLGLKPWLAGVGVSNVQEIDWWASVNVPGAGGAPVEFHLTPVQHWSARSLTDRSETLWGGWAVFGPDLHWYYSGDSGYSRDFVDTRARFAGRHTPERGGGFDLALIALGAYEPRWFMKEQHVNPQETVQVHKDLGARRSVGVHWGTFELTDEPLDQPPRDLEAARSAEGLSPDDIGVMAIGETRRVAPRRMTQIDKKPAS